MARHKVVIRQGFHGPSCQGQMISLQVGEFDKFELELYSCSIFIYIYVFFLKKNIYIYIINKY